MYAISCMGANQLESARHWRLPITTSTGTINSQCFGNPIEVKSSSSMFWLFISQKKIQ